MNQQRFSWLLAAAALFASCSHGGGSGIDPRIDPHFQAIPDLADPEEVDDSQDVNRYFDDGLDCRVWERSYAHGYESYPMLEEHSDVIYPGGDVQVGTLVQSIPASITAPRGGGDIVISNKNGSLVSARHLDEVSLAKVTEAMNEILRSQPGEFPADLTIHVARVHTLEELQIQLEASASYFDLFSASSGFQFREDEDVSSFLVTLQQNFYSMAFERPAQPHEFYAPGVRLEDLAPQVHEDNPAGYVSNVTYGRVFYLLIQATERATEMQTTLNANFIFDGFGGGFGGSIDYLSQFTGLSIHAYAYGGDQQDVLDSIFAGLTSWKAFKASLIEANDLLTAKPISYKVRSIATDRLVKNGLNVAYDYVDCTPTESCIPTLLTPHSGATLDNGCRNTANAVRWNFDWADCEAADRYQIEIRHPDFGVFRSPEVSTSEYGYGGNEPFVPSEHWSRWTWRVRARTFDAWRPWSEDRSFRLQAVDSECTTGIRIFTHPNFQGDSLFIEGDVSNLEGVPGWDDDIDSFQLFNLRGVRLFEDPGYRGASFYFDHSCPDVKNHQSHGFRANSASAIDLVN